MGAGSREGPQGRQTLAEMARSVATGLSESLGGRPQQTALTHSLLASSRGCS